jgi:endonuclease/exonuclease/phosphatase family metal-dependent hydrolase
VRVATFNLHAGVDGWGRPTLVLQHAKDLNADILICPEMWRGDDGNDFYDQLATGLSMKGVFAPLARAERIVTASGGTSWQPRLAHFTGEYGLYFSEHRTLSPAQRLRRSGVTIEEGDWGIGLLTRLALEDVRVESLGRLPRERVRRALIVAKVRDGERAFYVLAIHGAHLSHGSYRQYRRVSDIVASLDPSLPVLLGGDFNSWRPLLRLLLPGWQSLVRARTWPARHPHSQIDHLLGRGPWRRLGGGAIDAGSDHRALWADLALD